MTTLTSKLKSITFTLAGALAFLLGVQWALANTANAAASALPIGADPQPIGSAPITETITYTLYLPLIVRNHPIVTEVRALWVTRFDWTFYHRPVTTTDIDTIVDHAASAHFNMLLFQVRGTADAFYSSTLEPWAARLTGETTQTLGVDPGWDPLAYMITRAHSSGLQVQAYMNVYPAWICDRVGPITMTTPLHPFWQWTYASPYPNRTLQWREWSNDNPPAPMNLIPTSEGGTCGGANYLDGYLWASPANPLVQTHIVSVAVDLATRYDLDGLHLDLVRYSGANYSSDPATLRAFTDALQITPTLVFTTWQPDFQRAQINALVAQIYSATTALKPNLWVSAAVWPNYTSGYNSLDQDSKGWLANSIIDANMPMLYSSDILNDLSAWIARTQGFVNDAYGRYVIPGISGSYANFNDIAERIDAARSMGAPGIAIFSYSGLNANGYWDKLANGPFASPAAVPKPGWKP